MQINEACKRTKLTKKAIEYYTLQGLVCPSVLENGYKNYDEQDIEKLNKIRVLRKLDVSTEAIGHILNDDTNASLQTVLLKKELDHKRDMLKKAILTKLSQGTPYHEVEIELQSVEQGKIITDKLLDAFPGCYGRFVCMHFARFLNEPISTQTQRVAYETVLSYLDNLPDLDIPKDLEEYLVDGTKHIATEQILQMLKATEKSYQNPEAFLTENKEMLQQYLEYKKSDAYKNSPAYRWVTLIKAFNRSSGYNDIFIPAMKQLSSSYAAYYLQIQAANKKLLEQYPQIEQLDAEVDGV